MPLNIDIVQILLHMLNFVILAGGLTLLLFKPVKKFMADRKQYFDSLLALAVFRSAETPSQCCLDRT